MRVKGNSTIRNLHSLLIDKFGELAFNSMEKIFDETDAWGWKLRKKPRYQFSVSTLAGSLPENIVDIEVSISDESLENGEVVLSSEVELASITKLVEDILNEKIT